MPNNFIALYTKPQRRIVSRAATKCVESKPALQTHRTGKPEKDHGSGVQDPSHFSFVEFATAPASAQDRPSPAATNNKTHEEKRVQSLNSSPRNPISPHNSCQAPPHTHPQRSVLRRSTQSPEDKTRFRCPSPSAEIHSTHSHTGE